MCGRLNVTDSPGLRQLCEQLEIPLWGNDFPIRLSRYIRAAQDISIVFMGEQGTEIKNAVWWLLLEQTSR